MIKELLYKVNKVKTLNLVVQDQLSMVAMSFVFFVNYVLGYGIVSLGTEDEF